MTKTLLAVATFILAVMGTAIVVSAAEIKLLSAGGMRPVLGDLVSDFERTTGAGSQVEETGSRVNAGVR